VEQAADGAAALTRLDDRGAVAFDLLVADLAMPGLDGVAVIREARRRRPGLPAILLTGYAGDAAALAVGGALDYGGAFALLRKPITGAGLADQVAALLSVPRGASHEDGALASNHSRVAGGPADAGPAP
jgi:CheY-like chemotaxis protein